MRGGASSNPLRILDSKNPTMQEMIAGAQAMDHLGAESMAHFDGVQQVPAMLICRSRSTRVSCVASTTTT